MSSCSAVALSSSQERQFTPLPVAVDIHEPNLVQPFQLDIFIPSGSQQLIAPRNFTAR